MEPQKTMVCMCEKCGNEAEMTIKCEEMVPPAATGPSCCGPRKKQMKRSIVCTQCGGEADLIVDL